MQPQAPYSDILRLGRSTGSQSGLVLLLRDKGTPLHESGQTSKGSTTGGTRGCYACTGQSSIPGSPGPCEAALSSVSIAGKDPAT